MIFACSQNNIRYESPRFDGFWVKVDAIIRIKIFIYKNYYELNFLFIFEFFYTKIFKKACSFQQKKSKKNHFREKVQK